MANLVVLQGGEATSFDLGGDETVIGRHPDCTVQLQSNMVSRRHARVVRDGEGFFIEDLGSGNGTFVNGQRVRERTPLAHQDRIKLGPILLRFEEPQARGAAGGAAAADDEATIFKIDLSSGEDDLSTIMGSVEHRGGFGMLEVRPEAKLKGIIEIAKSLVGTVDLEAILPRIIETLFGIFPQADRGSILLKDAGTGRMRVAAQKHRRGDEDETVRLSRTILNKVLEEKTGILSADAASDERFEASESISALTIRSMMCVPLLSQQGEPMGVIHLDTQNPLNQFKKDDLDLLMAVAGQAALSYEGARLMVSHMERMRHESEMGIAKSVQRALLPEHLPQVDGYEFYASYDSAQAVGGDYYDSMMLGEEKICLAFGDVAGKGVPGALIMSRIASGVQNTMRFVPDVEEAIRIINNHMCATAVDGRFVTFILAVIDLKTHEMTFVNAGHMSPLVRRPDGEVEEFAEDSVGVPIGIVEDYPYDIVRRTLEPGEIVVFVTDGVDEAMNPQGELYTKERVVEFIRHAPPKADELGKALLADVRRHAGGRPQNDDITIMAFGRNPTRE